MTRINLAQIEPDMLLLLEGDIVCRASTSVHSDSDGGLRIACHWIYYHTTDNECHYVQAQPYNNQYVNFLRPGVEVDQLTKEEAEYHIALYNLAGI